MADKNSYIICTRCLMDVSDPRITFDENGECCYCQEFDHRIVNYRFSEEEANRRIQHLKDIIKSSAGKSGYDCIIGLSGGVDSSYVTLLAYRMGLNPLVIHFDNGWDSEIAVSNIKKIIEKCGFDLQTYVIDWPEFRDLQRSFIKSSVIDIEIITDHAIVAAMFNFANKYNIRYVLSGNNFLTEYGMPQSWLWRKQDARNIRAIQKIYGSMKLKTFPMLGTVKFALISKLGFGFRYAEPLNNINYSKKKAMQELKEEVGWNYYGGKHFESVFTKFYQCYILPNKFHIDKRRAHLSSLIRTGEISRQEALIELNKPIYQKEELRKDKEYVLKKLGFSEKEFAEIMSAPPKSHTDYPSDEVLYRFLRVVLDVFRQGKDYLRGLRNR